MIFFSLSASPVVVPVFASLVLAKIFVVYVSASTSFFRLYPFSTANVSSSLNTEYLFGFFCSFGVVSKRSPLWFPLAEFFLIFILIFLLEPVVSFSYGQVLHLVIGSLFAWLLSVIV